MYKLRLHLHSVLNVKLVATLLSGVLAASEQSGLRAPPPVSKAEETFDGFRRKLCPPAPCVIKGEPVTTVQQHKYLGTVLVDRTDFDANTDGGCKNENQRLFFLRRLQSFNGDRALMKMFYSAFIESVLSFSVMRWSGYLSLTKKKKKQLDEERLFSKVGPLCRTTFTLWVLSSSCFVSGWTVSLHHCSADR